MPTPEDFQGMLTSVVESQAHEVTLAKQAVLADYGREVRALVSALPPEVSKGLMAEYQAPTPALLNAMEDAIAARELALHGAGREAHLDPSWLAGAGGDVGSAAERAAPDDWNLRN